MGAAGRSTLRVAAALALVLYFAFVVIPACRTPNTHGFASYYAASRVLFEEPRSMARVYDRAWFQGRIDADGIAARDIFNTQPPTMALLLAPVAWMAPDHARIAWVLLSTAFWLGGVAILLSGLRAGKGPASPCSLLVVLAMTLLDPALAESLHWGQAYALLFFLLCATLSLSFREGAQRSFLPGVPLGLMLVLKTAGVWLLPLLLVGKRWRTLAGAIGTAVAVAVLTAPWIGADAWRAYARELPRLALEPVRYDCSYQTVTSWAGHLLTYDKDWSASPVADAPWLARLVMGAVYGATMTVSVWLQRLDGGGDEQALSLALGASLVVTMTPVAEGYHYLLVLPSLVIAFFWAASHPASKASFAALVAGTLLLFVPTAWYSAPSVRAGALALLAYPRVYGAFVLWGWLAVALHRLRTHAVDEPREAALAHAR